MELIDKVVANKSLIEFCGKVNREFSSKTVVECSKVLRRIIIDY